MIINETAARSWMLKQALWKPVASLGSYLRTATILEADRLAFDYWRWDVNNVVNVSGDHY